MSDPFAIPPRTYRFRGRTAVAELEGVLQRHNRDTDVVRIEPETEVRFDAHGLLFGRFRFVNSALYATANQLAEGLSSGLLTLIEEETGDRQTRNRFLAAWLNMLLSYRQPEIVRWGFVVDKSDRTVVGFVGPKYRTTTNLSFWQRIQEFCDSRRDRPRLFEAVLVNRRLDLVLVGTDAVKTPAGVFARGLLAQNAETSGTAVRVSNVVLHAESGSYSADRFYADTRVPHIRGRKFNTKMGQLFESLGERSLGDDELRRGLGQLQRSVVAAPKTVSQHDARVESIAAMMAGSSLVTITQARQIVASVLRVGRQTTQLQLYLAICGAATDYSAAKALKCRQLAYQLLIKAAGRKN